jgi:hypothetical protein
LFRALHAIIARSKSASLASALRHIARATPPPALSRGRRAFAQLISP